LAAEKNETSQEEDSSPKQRITNNKEKGSPKKNPNMLGNFTIYRVNKEFENF
jgi:hypothetical protein